MNRKNKVYTKKIIVKCSDEMLNKLKEIAKEQNIIYSEMIREILRKFIEDKERKSNAK